MASVTSEVSSTQTHSHVWATLVGAASEKKSSPNGPHFGRQHFFPHDFSSLNVNMPGGHGTAGANTRVVVMTMKFRISPPSTGGLVALLGQLGVKHLAPCRPVKQV